MKRTRFAGEQIIGVLKEAEEMSGEQVVERVRAAKPITSTPAETLRLIICGALWGGMMDFAQERGTRDRCSHFQPFRPI